MKGRRGFISMFENLKSKNGRQSKYEDRPNAGSYPSEGFSHAAGASSYSVKGNEASRLVRCRVCGFPCDKERDSKAKEGSWAGIGVNQGVQLTAGTSIGDARVPAAGNVGQTPDKYYDRVISGGCPACGTLNYAD